MMTKFRHLPIFALLIALTFTLTACGDNGVDTGKLESSFAQDGSKASGEVDAAIKAIDADQYERAMVILRGVASKAELTTDQKDAVADVVSQLKDRLAAMLEEATAAAEAAAADADEKMQDMKNNLMPK